MLYKRKQIPGIYYSDGIDSTGLKTVNFIKKGTVDSKNRPSL